MKKTFYYNFVPSKAEEEACKANKDTPFQVTRVLVETTDIYPTPKLDPQNPWRIKKSLTHSEVMTGHLVVPFVDAFKHVFRYWNLCMANHVVVLGQKMPVIVWDVSEVSNPKVYQNDVTFFDRLRNHKDDDNNKKDDYVLSCPDLICDRCLRAEDEIGLYWDAKSGIFQFKMLGRAV